MRKQLCYSVALTMQGILRKHITRMPMPTTASMIQNGIKVAPHCVDWKDKSVGINLRSIAPEQNYNTVKLRACTRTLALSQACRQMVPSSCWCNGRFRIVNTQRSFPILSLSRLKQSVDTRHLERDQ